MDYGQKRQIIQCNNGNRFLTPKLPQDQSDTTGFGKGYPIYQCLYAVNQKKQN